MIIDRGVPLWTDCEAGHDSLCTYSCERLELLTDEVSYISNESKSLGLSSNIRL